MRPGDEELLPIERALGGRPSGPRLDEIWRRLEPEVAPRRMPWSFSGWRVWLAVPVAAAAALMVVLLRPPQGNPWTARGQTAVVLDANCGPTKEAPCRVGQPVYLRILPANEKAVAYVLHVQGQTRELLAGPLAVSTQDPTALPVKLFPEPGDVSTGIRLEVLAVRDPLDEADLRSLRSHASPELMGGVLHLDVLP